jgi:hypothetical protein
MIGPDLADIGKHVVVVLVGLGSERAGEVEDVPDHDAGNVVSDRLGRAGQHDAHLLQPLFRLVRHGPKSSCWNRRKDRVRAAPRERNSGNETLPKRQRPWSARLFRSSFQQAISLFRKEKPISRAVVSQLETTPAMPSARALPPLAFPPMAFTLLPPGRSLA